MSELLHPTAETEQRTDLLPTGNALREIYKQRFAAIEPPTEYAFDPEPGVETKVFSVDTDNSPLSGDELRQEFIAQATREASESSWWNRLHLSLDKYAKKHPDNLRLTATHTLDILHNNKPTDQQYEVFEIGSAQPNPETSAVVFDTLELIDQFSGGALAANREGPRIVLGNGIRLIDNPNGEGEMLGIANEKIIFINISRLQEIADQTGASFNELLAVTVVHEYLGHGLERKVMGKTGQYFTQYFDYSSERTTGDMFDDMHKTIKAKDASQHDSKPGREYGRVNPAEDVATSVDATIADTMGWDSVQKYPRMRSQLDAYRQDLVVRLLDSAADAAAKHDHNSGVVGSELNYITNEANEVQAVEPARKFKITTAINAEAVQQEIDAQVKKYSPDGPFIIYNDDEI